MKIKDNANIINQASVLSNEVLAGKKILVVDDDPANIFLMKHLLAKGKMDVITAVNGMDGLEKLNQNPDIDIVLMDIMMPIMDGYQAIIAIRKQKKYETLPIIVVTANAMENPKSFYAVGATDYIIKPVEKNKMFEMMAAWLTPIQ